MIDISIAKLRSSKELVSDQALEKALRPASRLRLISMNFFDGFVGPKAKVWRKSTEATEILQHFLVGLSHYAPQPLPWKLSIDSNGKPNDLTLGCLITKNYAKLLKRIEISTPLDLNSGEFTTNHKRAIRGLLRPIGQTVLFDNIHILKFRVSEREFKPMALASFTEATKRWLESIINLELGERKPLDFADEKLELTAKKRLKLEKEKSVEGDKWHGQQCALLEDLFE